MFVTFHRLVPPASSGAQRRSPKLSRSTDDKRTAMHLAASEGMLEVVRALVEDLGANHSPVDRWGGTPLDDALRGGHSEVRMAFRS